MKRETQPLPHSRAIALELPRSRALMDYRVLISSIRSRGCRERLHAMKRIASRWNFV